MFNWQEFNPQTKTMFLKVGGSAHLGMILMSKGAKKQKGAKMHND